MDEVTVHASATVSNVVCGFDCLGFALAEPFDVMTVRQIDEPTVRILNRDDFGLPTEPSGNVAGVSLLAMLLAMSNVDEKTSVFLQMIDTIKKAESQVKWKDAN